MKFAYADPPYLGLAAKLYGGMHPEAAEYDKVEKHEELIQRLCDEYQDGWALSLHEPSLREILALCPPEARVAVWAKPWCSFRPGAKHAHYAWEPVIFSGGRPFEERCHANRDYTLTPMVLGGVKTFGKGRKPPGLVVWILESLLNAIHEDEFHDLFPGSGGVGEAWEAWKRQPRLPFNKPRGNAVPALL